ncbi:Ppx/GppA phosphatase family protein [Sessilibacter sp. MAH4]
MQDLTPHQDHYFVAVDLGSNSFHMLIVRENHGLLQVVDRVKEMVQIARGLKDGQLSQEAQDRAIECLRCFNERIVGIPSTNIKAVGTKALRAAKNARAFLREAEVALGVPIELISGYEEARLVYAGVASSISQDHRKRLIVDIGGASTEFIIGQDNTPTLLESLSIGCVTYTEQFLTNAKGDLEVTPETMKAVYIAAREELEAIQSQFRKEGWDITYGTSGTMKSITEMMPELTPAGVITRVGVTELYHKIAREGELKVEGIAKPRRYVMPAGMAVLRAILDSLSIEELHVSDSALKEGLIHETIGRRNQKDIRNETVRKYLDKYHIDAGQAQRVKETALALIAQADIKEDSGLNPISLIGWAAQLHEIGLMLSHSGYHHHGRYILEHCDLAGFNRYEQFLLATLVGMHRRKLNQQSLESLNPNHREPILKMVICLRLAVILNRKRDSTDQTPKVTWNGDKIHLDFGDGWLPNNQLSERSLQQESEYLARINVTMEYS